MIIDSDSFEANFSKLPYDIMLQIIQYLPGEYIKEFFLYWQSTRQLIINNYYSKELHCIVTPLRKQKHICVDGTIDNDIYDLHYFGEIDEFFAMNPDIIPRKLVFITGTDFYFMFKLFTMYKDRILRSKDVEILMDGCQYQNEDFEYMLKSLTNISRLQLGGFKFNKIKEVLNNELPKMENLTNLQYIGHDVRDWSSFKFPPNIRSLDCSWFSFTNILTLEIPPQLTDLYMNYCDIKSDTLEELSPRLPKNLKVLMITYNAIEEFNCNLIPPSVEKLDLSYNKTKRFVSNHQNIWPENLVELNLGFNHLDDQGIASLSSQQWPDFLKILRIDNNKISNIYLLNNLPDSIEDLDLNFNNLRFEVEGKNLKEFKFPANLKRLNLSNNRHLISNFMPELSTRINFPPELEHLNLNGCGINDLKYFKLPSSLKELNLQANSIQDLHSVDWKRLVHLRDINLSMNKIESLQGWMFPPNVEKLDFTKNKLSSLDNLMPIFNHQYNGQSKFKQLIFEDNVISDISNIQIPSHGVNLILTRNRLPTTLHLSEELLKLNELDVSLNEIEDITYEKSLHPQPLRYLTLHSYPGDRHRPQKGIAVLYEKIEEAIGHKILKKQFSINNIDLKAGISAFKWDK
ncbi:hypothetical protein CLIB1444_02S05336 [[Candida] jaroonii]|uniref:Uncharacterized protein n=1 Tax=[Candida] jaroonii TaxID=467808 RepID=A0ACA9Y2V8_9ASCO|nr:hypothetical protein CLIB1444_02S05336 [[Candida] jaroonii]